MDRHGIRYPKNTRIICDGGLNTKISPANILDEESPDCANVVFTDGAFATREGFQKLNTTPIGTYPIDGLFVRKSNAGAETMIAMCKGSAYTLDGTSTFVTIVSSQSQYTAGVRFGGCNYISQLFVSNGNIPMKWNGTDWTRQGVYAPNSAPTAASAATGVLTGEYRYKITYVNSYLVESDVNTTTATLTVASATIGLTSVPVAPQSYGVASRNIYRTETSGATWKRVGTISDNTTTTYTDSTADSSLGVAAPTDNGVPPKWNVAVCHQDRLFVNDIENPSWVWYSNIGEPHTFASTSFLFFGDDAGDTVKGLAVFNNTLVVACVNSIWLVYMQSTSPSDWVVIKSKSSFGTVSPYGLASINNTVVFPAMQNDKFVGFATISGVEAQPDVALTTVGVVGSELSSQKIESQMFSVLEGSLLGDISAIVYQNKAYFSVPYGDTATANNRVYCYDFSIAGLVKNKAPAWIPWTGISAESFVIYNRKLYFGSSTNNGYCYQLESGQYNDDSVAINSYLYTKEFFGYGEHSEKTKDFRSLSCLIDRPGAWMMNIGYKTDALTGGATIQQINLTPGGGLWGTMVWGTGTWGGGKARDEIKVTIPNAVGTRIQFFFSNQNTANQSFKVHNLAFNYNVRGDR